MICLFLLSIAYLINFCCAEFYYFSRCCFSVRAFLRKFNEGMLLMLTLLAILFYPSPASVMANGTVNGLACERAGERKESVNAQHSIKYFVYP